MASGTTIRGACPADVPVMASIEVNGFFDSPAHKAMFPESLRVNAGKGDQLEWYTSRMAKGIEAEHTRYIVAVGEEGEVLGFAEWQSPRKDADQTAGKMTPEEREMAQEERMARLPSYLDRQALMSMQEETGDLINAGKLHFGGRNLAHMWTLNSIAVDEQYRGRGIGKMLAQWGLNEAERNGEDVWLVSAPAGRAMYTKLGLKEVAEGSRCGEGQYLMVKFRE